MTIRKNTGLKFNFEFIDIYLTDCFNKFQIRTICLTNKKELFGCFVNYYRGNAALKFMLKNISLIYGHGTKFYEVTLKQLV